MRARFQLFTGQRLADDRRVGRLDRHGGDGLAFGVLDVAADAGQRAAGADAGDEYVDVAVGVFPDFRAGGFFMDRRVGRVAELLQDQVTIRVGGDDLFRFGDGAFHAFRPFGQYQIGAQRLEQLAALDAHGFRHGQRQLVTACGGNEGQRDAGVAAGRLHQLFAGGQHAALFRIPNHIGTDAAFDAEARVA